MSDLLLVSIITGGFAFLSAVFTGVMTFLIARLGAGQKKAAEVQEKAAAKVEEVAAVLEQSTIVSDAKLDSLALVSSATHTLVNNNMAIQLKLNAAVTRRLANITKNSSDVEAAELAEKLVAEHEAKQAIVDAATPPPSRERH
jgi:hypothetical protein